MALFGFNSRRYEMLMSAVYCSCNSTHHKLRCIGKGTYQLVNDVPAELMRASVLAHLCKLRTYGRPSHRGIADINNERE